MEFLHASIDLNGGHVLDNVDVGGVVWQPQAASHRLEYLAALLNSAVLRWYFPRISAPFRGGYRSANRQFLDLLPIRLLDFASGAERSYHDAIVRVVEWLLWLRCQPTVAESTREHPRDPLIAAYFEQWLNALVYELYFPAELHAAGLHLFTLTAQHTLPEVESVPSGQRLSSIRELFETLYDINHPLRAALFGLGSLETVRIIEGKE